MLEVRTLFGISLSTLDVKPESTNVPLHWLGAALCRAVYLSRSISDPKVGFGLMLKHSDALRLARRQPVAMAR